MIIVTLIGLKNESCGERISVVILLESSKEGGNSLYFVTIDVAAGLAGIHGPVEYATVDELH